ncbi:MAG TPA: hypothetical protein VFF54_05990 [Thermodesulfobacteriota bacterium]|nr:hypothetical protein [Thermodesulfobacteriota bacterium]
MGGLIASVIVTWTPSMAVDEETVVQNRAFRFTESFRYGFVSMRDFFGMT